MDTTYGFGDKWAAIAARFSRIDYVATYLSGWPREEPGMECGWFHHDDDVVFSSELPGWWHVGDSNHMVLVKGEVHE